jgi:hypothetical protein
MRPPGRGAAGSSWLNFFGCFSASWLFVAFKKMFVFMA